MSLTAGLAVAVAAHKAIASDYIAASTVQITIETIITTVIVSSGAPMFANLDEVTSTVTKGPYKCIWTDANAAKVSDKSREANLIRNFQDAEVIAKLWLADILVDSAAPYGETYFDRASYVVSSSKRYEVLGYDRFGLGTTDPYIIAVVLRGSFASDG